MISDGVGVDVPKMQYACEQLKNHAGEISMLIDMLDSMEKKLPSIWEGEDIELLNVKFEKFKSELQQLPDVISDIARWGEETTENYKADELKSRIGINEVFGGMI